jgi:hypothetical protein
MTWHRGCHPSLMRGWWSGGVSVPEEGEERWKSRGGGGLVVVAEGREREVAMP